MLGGAFNAAGDLYLAEPTKGLLMITAADLEKMVPDFDGAPAKVLIVAARAGGKVTILLVLLLMLLLVLLLMLLLLLVLLLRVPLLTRPLHFHSIPLYTGDQLR